MFTNVDLCRFQGISYLRGVILRHSENRFNIALPLKEVCSLPKFPGVLNPTAAP